MSGPRVFTRTPSVLGWSTPACRPPKLATRELSSRAPRLEDVRSYAADPLRICWSHIRADEHLVLHSERAEQTLDPVQPALARVERDVGREERCCASRARTWSAA